MERENHINPELTGQAQNAYSNGRGRNMPEGGEGAPISEGDLGRLQGSDVPVEVRRAVEEVVSDLARSDSTPDHDAEPRVDVPPAGSGGAGSGEIPPGDEPPTADGAPPEDEDSSGSSGGDSSHGQDRDRESESGRHTEEDSGSKGEKDLDRRIGMYLKVSDTIELDKEDPTDWIDARFNEIYSLASQGQELDSPLIQRMQSLFGEAAEYITSHRGDKDPELVQKFTSEFIDKLNLIFMRSTIEQRNLEGAKNMAKRTGAKAIFRSMTYENGNVGRFYNRLQDHYEDLRLAEGKGEQKKILPETEAKLQDEVIEQEMKLATNGVGNYGEKYQEIRRVIEGKGLTDRQRILLKSRFGKDVSGATSEDLNAVREMEIDERMRIEITRAVRTAYDLFIVTQRHAVINSRSGALSIHGSEGISSWKAYLGQPGAAFASFNAENLLWEEFGLFNKEDREFVKRIKLDMARDDLNKRVEKGEDINMSEWSEQRLEEYGKVLFKDLYAVADFFSSGWRMGGMLEQLDSYAEAMRKTGKQMDSKDFGLFVRLRATSGEDRKNAWGKVSQYRPEEIIKLFRDRSNNSLSPLYEKMRNQGITLTQAQIDKGMTEYDVFKLQYGSVISAIRDFGFSADPPRQIDFANLTSDPDFDKFKNIIDRVSGVSSTEKVMTIFKEMKRYVENPDNKVINQLMTDTKFVDIYTRVLVADDLLLGDLETRANELGIIELSRKLSVDSGTDALVRNYNDLEHSGNAMTALLQFIKEDNPEARFKAAFQFAEEASMYGGQGSRAKGVRFTAGTYLNLAKKDWMWNVLGVDKGINRRAISELQRIYGPQAEAIDRVELRHKLDDMRLKLIDVFGKEDAEGYYHDLEELLEVRGRDLNKLKGAAFLIFMIAGSLLMFPAAAKEGFDPKKLSL